MKFDSINYALTLDSFYLSCQPSRLNVFKNRYYLIPEFKNKHSFESKILSDFYNFHQFQFDRETIMKRDILLKVLYCRGCDPHLIHNEIICFSFVDHSSDIVHQYSLISLKCRPIFNKAYRLL